ncbi:WD40 repeat domain-containing serine/threonine protein kinase [Actinocorallia libanotica]|uniref:Protein kinase domain-containing protein n=1 Tax=Actinocorallia libanotica TaxID=46162 RepID=A0ABN1QJ12_9ACTN
MRAGAELAGRYVLVRSLGRGSFGEVWEAGDLLHDRRAAIKFLYPEIAATDPLWLEKFKQEARIGVRVRHSGITAVDNIGEYEGQWYLAMEFLDGHDLARETAARPGGLAVPRVTALGALIADALAAAHKDGVVHRDLKPGNIMLLDGDRIKICDFGIAHIADLTATHSLSGRRVGTPAYMAPEQWLGDPVDHRTDLYALGGILYTMLTGRTVFPGPSVSALMGQHLNQEPVAPSEIRAGIPAELDRIVLELLAKTPSDRPDSAERVRAALEAPPVASGGTGRPGPVSQPPLHPARTGAPPALNLDRPPDKPAAAVRRPGAVPRRGRREFLAAVLAAGVTVPVVALSLKDRGAGPVLGDPTPSGSTAPSHQGPATRIPSKGPVGTTEPSGGPSAVPPSASGKPEPAVGDTPPPGGEQEPRTLHGHSDEVLMVAFSRDGRTLATGDRSGEVRLWDVASGRTVRFLKGHTDAVYAAAFSPDGTMVATCSEDGTVRTWRTATGRAVRTLTGHAGSVYAAAFSPDGRTLASGGWDGTVRLWDPADGDTRRVLQIRSGNVKSVAFTGDGATLACGAEGTASLWRPATGKRLRTLTGHTGWIGSVAFDRSGSRLATACDDGTIRLWNTGTGKTLQVLALHTAAVRAVSFSPDSHTLASGSDDKTARLWDASTGRPLRTLTRHTASVNGVAFNPDNDLLATTSWDRTTCLWPL